MQGQVFNEKFPFSGKDSMKIFPSNFNRSLLPPFKDMIELQVTDEHNNNLSFNCSIQPETGSLVISGPGWSRFAANLQVGNEVTLYRGRNGDYKVKVK